MPLFRCYWDFYLVELGRLPCLIGTFTLLNWGVYLVENFFHRSTVELGRLPCLFYAVGTRELTMP